MRYVVLRGYFKKGAKSLNVVSKLENYLKQLAHPFYKRVDEFRDEVKREALLKAADKYPEPFNPQSWTSEQLAKHAMAENYDQGNYIIGLYDKCVELEERLKEMQIEAEYWRLRCIKEGDKGLTPVNIKKPKYADLDD
jgi:hypothetical protein